jgi:antitoxin component YwqK of YwqJK toxin-antitoxin module
MKYSSLLALFLSLTTLVACSQTDTLNKSEAKLKSGTYKEYYPNHSLKIISNYDKGILHGEYLTYFENGEKESVCYFKDGKKDGKWIYYHANGNKKSIIIYNSNEIIVKSIFDENAEIKMVETYKNGIPSYVFMYDKGKLISEGKTND